MPLWVKRQKSIFGWLKMTRNYFGNNGFWNLLLRLYSYSLYCHNTGKFTLCPLMSPYSRSKQVYTRLFIVTIQPIQIDVFFCHHAAHTGKFTPCARKPYIQLCIGYIKWPGKNKRIAWQKWFWNKLNRKDKLQISNFSMTCEKIIVKRVE